MEVRTSRLREAQALDFTFALKPFLHLKDLFSLQHLHYLLSVPNSVFYRSSESGQEYYFLSFDQEIKQYFVESRCRRSGARITTYVERTALIRIHENFWRHIRRSRSIEGAFLPFKTAIW